MAKPVVLKRLEKGKIIDAQEGFVDTFNYLVDFIHNLKGDHELGGDGHIEIDRKIEDFPVIRLVGEVGGGGAGMGGAFAYDEETKVIGPGAVEINGVSYPVNQSGYKTDGEGSWRVEIHVNEGIVNVMKGDGFESPPEGLVYYPLYDLVDGKVVADWRSGCHVGGAGGVQSVRGNSESAVDVAGKKIVFKSADDSNIKVNVTKGENDEIIVEIGAYYK